jgi:hypothetical protein
MNFYSTVVVDEAEPSKLVHEETHAGARGPDHSSECFLTGLCSCRFWLSLLSKARQQQEPSRQTLPKLIEGS